MDETFDLVVIGNGSAGDNLARTLGRRGTRVAVVEREHLGGECLNDGCVPSKALISAAHRARLEGWGWDEVMARVHRAQADVRGDDPDGGMQQDGIELAWGEAEFVEPRVVRVGARTLRATDVVIATGTGPGLPPIAGLAEAKPITNRQVFTLPSLPGRLAVIGAGPIGLELGQAFHRLGSEVTLLEAGPRIALTEDEQVSAELRRLFEAEGMRVVTSAGVDRVDRAGGVVRVELGGEAIEVDEVLVAAGRVPQVPKGLDALGLELDERGYIAISPCGRTNLEGVWAAGDVTGKFQFTHYAGYQAHHIGRHIMEGVCLAIPDTLVPWAIFTEPEVGHAGLTEEQARAKYEEVAVTVLEAADLDWFRTTFRTEGFAKVIADGATGRLLGAHFICDRASTIVGEAALAIQNGLDARTVAQTIHPYPTASEIFRWACARLV